MEKIGKILVPTDFSPCAQEALDYAVWLAPLLGATILLVHIWSSPVYPGELAYVNTVPPDELKKKVCKELEETAGRWRQSGIFLETHIIRGTPTIDIVTAAQVFSCDLIVMGTHGREGISHILMGSVAEKVVRISPIPVLTVRQAAEEKQKGRHAQASSLPSKVP